MYKCTDLNVLPQYSNLNACLELHKIYNSTIMVKVQIWCFSIIKYHLMGILWLVWYILIVHSVDFRDPIGTKNGNKAYIYCKVTYKIFNSTIMVKGTNSGVLPWWGSILLPDLHFLWLVLYSYGKISNFCVFPWYYVI